MKPIKLTDAQMDAALEPSDAWLHRLAAMVTAHVRERGIAPTGLQLAGMAEVARLMPAWHRELTHVEKTLLGALK